MPQGQPVQRATAIARTTYQARDMTCTPITSASVSCFLQYARDTQQGSTRLQQ